MLRELRVLGHVPRDRVPEVTGYKDRQARTVVSRLSQLNLIESATPGAPLCLAIPHHVAADWFPKLYR